MRYAEYPPLPALAPCVRCVWTLEGDGPGDVSPVLPDGRPELIVHLGDPFDVIGENGAATRQPGIVFAGQLTERLLMRPGRRAAVVGVRFHPHGAAGLLRVGQSELAGSPTGVDLIDPSLQRVLASVRSATADPARAAALVQQALARMVDMRGIDARVRFAVGRIEQAGGRVSIAALADAAAVTPRHLERLFLQQVGVAPKRLARITRFQRALLLLEHGDGAGTAVDCGYADQAHFIRDFRLLAGCSPSAHLLNGAALTGFFVDRA